MFPLLALLLPVLWISNAHAITVDDLSEDGSFVVDKVDIEGVGFWLGRELRAGMLSVPAPWYQPWKRWTDPVVFNSGIFRNDLERVAALLRESGHYQAELSHELFIEESDDAESRGSIEILLEIDPGPVAVVRQVGVTATDFELSAAEATALLARVPLRVDDPFTQEEYDKSRASLERHFREQSFAYASVAKAAVVDTSDDSARVAYTITRGQPAVFGATTITGLSSVDEALVRRELDYQPGEPFDPRKVESTQASLFGLELFRSAMVKPSNLEAGSGVVDVGIELVEGPPRAIKIGVGYGLEDQLRGQLQWQHNNFLGGGRQLGARLKASFIEQTIEGEFRQPYFLDPSQTLVVPLTQGRQDEPGFTLVQARLAPRVERLLLPELRISIGYNLEYDRLSDVPDETKQRLGDFRANGWVSSWTATIERNTAGDLLDPTEGSVLSLSIEQAGGPWQGHYTFYRGVAEAKKYFPVFSAQTFAARLRVGAGDGFGQSDDLPIFRRFYAGGASSTRGYGRHKLGPLTSDGDPIGGRSLIETGLELRTPVWGDLGAAVFVDAGAVDERLFRYQLGDLRFGVGPGIRYNTPVGPLRLDIGFPINAPSGEPSWQIHFSIGQAF